MIDKQVQRRRGVANWTFERFFGMIRAVGPGSNDKRGATVSGGSAFLLWHGGSRCLQPGSAGRKGLDARHADQRSGAQLEGLQIAASDHSIDGIPGQRIALAAENLPGFLDAQSNRFHFLFLRV
jgi:hypothetical protein